MVCGLGFFFFRKRIKAAVVLFCLIVGCMAENGLAIEQKTFGGNIDFIGRNVSFYLDFKERGVIDLKGSVNDNDQYNISLDLKHFKFGNSDILSNFESSGIVVYSQDKKIKTFKGKAWTQHTLLNRKPFSEFSVDYELSYNQLKIVSFSWANLDLKGKINFKPSPFIDLVILINDADVKDLADILGINDNGLDLGGTVSGNLKIQGPPDGIKVEGRLVASGGRVSEIKFNSARINFEGTWPIMRFANSYINASDGIIYDLGGKFNLGELANFASPDHKVIVYSSNNAMRFQDWVIRRHTDVKGQDMVEAEYPLKKNQALKMRIKNEEETLAWEKSVKF